MFIANDTRHLVKQIAQILESSDSTLAVSESACGGLISASLVSVPGASKWFVGSTTTYALRSRLTLSGWSQQDISAYTGPSEEVAQRLARNLRMELGATYVLAETGWAGPGEKAGTVFLSVASQHSSVDSCRQVTGLSNRVENMEAFAQLALEYLLAVLSKSHTGIGEQPLA